MKIQSFSDVITNSSSEVFVMRGKGIQEASDLIHKLYELLERDIDSDMTFRSVSKHKLDSDTGFNLHVKTGDLIIEEIEDNRIPDAVSEFIANIDSLVENVTVENYGV